MTKQHNDYYTYAYLREDRTPYYIGKGRGRRAFLTKRVGAKPPKDKSRIIYLKQNLTEEEAFKHEIYMIAILGRKDLGTGILRNRTNGGEGSSGAVRSEEEKKKLSEANTGENHPQYGVPHTEERKRKNREANTGENHPNYGVPWTEERKKAVSGENNSQYGRTGALHFHSKAIIAINPDGTEEHFGGVREAARKLETNPSHLSKYLKDGHVLTRGKFKGWRFFYENPVGVL